MHIIHEESDNLLLGASVYLQRWHETGNMLELVCAAEKLDKARIAWEADKGKAAPLRREYHVYNKYLIRALGRMANGVKTAQNNDDLLQALQLKHGKGAAIARRQHERASLLDAELLYSILLSSKGKPDYSAVAATYGVSQSYLRARISVIHNGKKPEPEPHAQIWDVWR